jgi:Uma2 family endonuclease
MATIAAKRTPRAIPLPKGTARIRKDMVHLSRPKYDGLKMSLRDFLDWEREPDGWKYEWNNGIIEINEVSMRNTERGIVQHIIRAFTKTQAYQSQAELLPETDCLLPSGQVRRPDIAYFTYEQIQASARGEQPVPPFAIELISKNDRVGKVDEKLAEYFASGVLCVWHILPESSRVKVYTSLKDVQICSDEDVCSARPALDFTIRAEEIFA